MSTLLSLIWLCFQKKREFQPRSLSAWQLNCTKINTPKAKYTCIWKIFSSSIQNEQIEQQTSTNSDVVALAIRSASTFAAKPPSIGTHWSTELKIIIFSALCTGVMRLVSLPALQGKRAQALHGWVGQGLWLKGCRMDWAFKDGDTVQQRQLRGWIRVLLVIEMEFCSLLGCFI